MESPATSSAYRHLMSQVVDETQVRVVNVNCVKVFVNTSTDSVKQEADHQPDKVQRTISGA